MIVEEGRLFLTRKARKLYSKFKLSVVKCMVIVGSLFGDGCLTISDGEHTPRFYETHSIKQLDYIKWKAKLLGVKVRFFAKPNNKDKIAPAIYVRHRDNPFTVKERNYFMKNYKKILTIKLAKKLKTSTVSLHSLAYRMGITTHARKPLTSKEREYFIKHYQKIPIHKLAKKLKVTTGCLYSIAHRQGLTKSRKNYKKGEAGERICVQH